MIHTFKADYLAERNGITDAETKDHGKACIWVSVLLIISTRNHIKVSSNEKNG